MFVEKPFTGNFKLANDLMELAVSKSLMLMVGKKETSRKKLYGTNPMLTIYANNLSLTQEKKAVR